MFEIKALYRKQFFLCINAGFIHSRRRVFTSECLTVSCCPFSSTKQCDTICPELTTSNAVQEEIYRTEIMKG